MLLQESTYTLVRCLDFLLLLRSLDVYFGGKHVIVECFHSSPTLLHTKPINGQNWEWKPTQTSYWSMKLFIISPNHIAERSPFSVVSSCNHIWLHVHVCISSQVSSYFTCYNNRRSLSEVTAYNNVVPNTDCTIDDILKASDSCWQVNQLQRINSWTCRGKYRNHSF